MATVSNRRMTGRSTTKEQRCNVCGRTFDSFETLDSHKRMEHSQRSQAPAGVG